MLIDAMLIRCRAYEHTYALRAMARERVADITALKCLCDGAAIAAADGAILPCHAMPLLICCYARYGASHAMLRARYVTPCLPPHLTTCCLLSPPYMPALPLPALRRHDIADATDAFRF